MNRWIISVAFICAPLASFSCSDETVAPQNADSNLSSVKWFYSSPPVGYTDQILNQIALFDHDRGELLWFSPNNVQVADINPAETSASRRNDPVSALEIIYVPSDSADVQHSWGALVSAVAQQDADISRKLYLEVWLNDYVPIERSAQRRGYVYIDVGQVNEDAVWDPQTPPFPRDGILDFEDHNYNGGQAEVNDDRGLDFLFNDDEPPRRPGTKTFSPFTPAQDPTADDYLSTADENAPENTIGQRIVKYRGINGTEGNHRLDGEDLNGNYQLDPDNAYVQYKIALADSALTDNRRDFSVANQDLQSGWRMYRIPLSQIDNWVGALPNFAQIKHVRLWFRGIAPGDTLDLQVAGLEFVETVPDSSGVLLTRP